MAPPAGPNGVLPATLLQKNAPAQQAPRGPKTPQPRLKLLCRRLPPGLTKAELVDALGDEWRLGAGKVDWMDYRKGKISTDPAKPSRLARAYFHVTKQDHVKELGDRVRAVSFHDAAKSWQDPALVGSPTVEYASYNKMPGGRRRNDNRQGTIDQDPEYQDFLESLTKPISKPAAVEHDGPREKVKTTPLIEALREKKANRDKPTAKASRQGRGDGKEDSAGERKILAKPGKENNLATGDKGRRPSKAEKIQATKEAIKILNKEAAASRSPAAAAPAVKSSASPAPERKRGNVALAKSMLQRDLGVGPAPNRRRGTKREVGAAASDAGAQAKEAKSSEDKAKRAPVAQPATTSTSDDPAQVPRKEPRPTRAERRAHKAIQNDKPHDKATTSDVKPQTPLKTPLKTPAPHILKTPGPQILKKPQSAQAPAAPKGPVASRAPPTEPAAARNSPAPVKPQLAQPNQAKTETAPTPPSNPTPRAAPANPVPAPTSKQAFLKHANPSQGITEPLIEEAMKMFGGIDKVEIDKRKGFAYVDFAEPEGLQKAMAASPIKIAQGAVQVLERKDRGMKNPRFGGPPTGPARGGAPRGNFGPRGGRGGRGGARGGGHVGPAPAASAGDATPTAPAAASPASAPAASAPPAPAPATSAGPPAAT